MYARNDFKRLFYKARFALAVAQRRFAARIDALVASWLVRCAADIEAAQGWFPDSSAAPEFGMGREPSRLIPTLG